MKGSTIGDEQIKTMTDKVGTKESDVFNFGEILFEVITRETMSESLVDAIGKHRCFSYGFLNLET